MARTLAGYAAINTATSLAPVFWAWVLGAKCGAPHFAPSLLGAQYARLRQRDVRLFLYSLSSTDAYQRLNFKGDLHLGEVRRRKWRK
jgi:hypothetical protein